VLFASAGLGLPALVSGAGCSVLVPPGDLQCASSDDCRARGFGNAACIANACQVAIEAGPPPIDAGADADAASDPWACLQEDPVAPSTGNVTVDILAYDALKPFTFAGQVDGGSDIDVVSYVPQAGVTVLACPSLDSTCTMAVVGGPTDTDDAGNASMSIPGGFTGFFLLERADSLPTYFYPAGHLVSAGGPPGGPFTYPTSTTSHSSVAGLSFALGVQQNQDLDAGPGILSVTQFDCNDHHAKGVTFSASPAPERTIYLQNGLPSMAATQTTVEGSAVMVNAPPAVVTVTSTISTDLSGSPPRSPPLTQTASVLVRPGSVTILYMRPRAR
jgi:hypothetical protein